MTIKRESKTKSESQQTFERCQKCGQMVEKTFQKGICRFCLQNSFNKLRILLNQSHAAAENSQHD